MHRPRRLLMTALVATLCVVSSLSWSGTSSAAETDESILVVSSGEHALVMIDPESGHRTAFFRVGLHPESVAVAPDGRTAVVTNRGARVSGKTICLVDLFASNLVRTIELEASRTRADQSIVKQMFHRPMGVAFVPGQPRVLVSCADEGALLLVDLEEARVIADVKLGEEDSGDVVVDRKGQFAYVANRGSGTVSVVSLGRMRIVNTIEAGGGPTGMKLHPVRDEIWVTNAETNSISIIDLESRDERIEFSCGAMPVDLAFTPDGKFAIVANLQEGNLSVIETATRRIDALVELPRVSRALAKERPVELPGRFGRSPLPSRILMDPSGERAWITTRRDDRLHQLDTATWRIRRSARAAAGPVGVGWCMPKAAGDGDALGRSAR